VNGNDVVVFLRTTMLCRVVIRQDNSTAGGAPRRLRLVCRPCSRAHDEYNNSMQLSNSKKKVMCGMQL
jgi:hypothetical protein